MEDLEKLATPAKSETTETSKDEANKKEKKKKISLAEFKIKTFATDVKVEQMQFLKTAGG